MKTLYNRLMTLRKSAKSGVVGFCGDIKNKAKLSFMVYFHSLGYVFVSQGLESSYFHVESENLLRKALKDFSTISRFKTASELQQFEAECLEPIFADLLWHMSHEMETENHTYETFVDEQTGEEYIIQRLLRIISCDNWRSLYAASRAVIYNRLNVI